MQKDFYTLHGWKLVENDRYNKTTILESTKNKEIGKEVQSWMKN